MKKNIKVSNECNSVCAGVKVPTDDEMEILNSMRILKDRVRDLKTKKEGLKNSDNEKYLIELRDIEEVLEECKGEWNRLENRRKEAARERMIMLGHEKP